MLRSWDALSARPGWSCVDFPFRFCRACDLGDSQLQVLCGISAKDTQGCMCVFKDLTFNLAPAGQRWIAAATPHDKMDKDSAINAYAQMLSWLLENRAWLLPPGLMRYCLAHGDMCPIHPKFKTSSQTSIGQPSSASTSDKDPSTAVQNEEHEEVTDVGDGPLWSHLAGVTCDGWSNIGGHARFGHASEILSLIHI